MAKKSTSIPNFDAEYRQIAYGKFLRAMLEDCLLEEKIQPDEVRMDIQMGQLAERFMKNMDQLDMTNRRIKEIGLVVEQKRLLDLKRSESAQFFQMTDDSNVSDLLQHLNTAEKACLGQLETKNVDFGFDKDSGHKKLLESVSYAIEGLDQIKKRCNLDVDKFKEYEKTEHSLKQLKKDKVDLENLKTDFDTKFPKLSEKVIQEASDKLIDTFASFNMNY